MTNGKSAQERSRNVPWTAAEKATLKELIGLGLELKEIASRLPGRTDRGVGKQLQLMRRDKRIPLHGRTLARKESNALDPSDPGVVDDEYRRFENSTRRASAMLAQRIQQYHGAPA